MKSPFDKPVPDRPARIAGVALLGLLLVLLALRGGWVVAHARSFVPVGGGEVAPAFKLPLLTGGEVAVGTGERQVTVLDFFATWCEPCREALPHVDALARRYQERGVRFIAVDAEDIGSRPAVKFIAERLRLTLPIALGGEEVSGLYKINTLPTTVIIGRDGSISRVLVGVHSEEELARHIDRALGQ